MLAGCGKPGTDVNSTIFYWTAKNGNCGANFAKGVCSNFSVLGKKKAQDCIQKTIQQGLSFGDDPSQEKKKNFPSLVVQDPYSALWRMKLKPLLSKK